MQPGIIAVVDFGAGNLHSVLKAIGYLGYSATITTSPQEVLQARAVILPGVGAATPAMNRLQALGLVEPLRQVIAQRRPFLGICLGMQLLFSRSQEGRGQPCLDILPGEVTLLPPGLKVPHMGWNLVRQKIPHPIFDGIPNPAYFYFVHSYYAQPQDTSLVAGETEYGLPFASLILRDNLIATQFHPEKSGQVGLRLYQNFFRLLDKTSPLH